MGEAPAESDAEFDKVLVRSIDETIDSLLGKRVLDALHEHLIHLRGISIEETPAHLDVLMAVFERTFGTSARTISKAIARRLFSKFDLEFRPRGGMMTLIDYVQEAKARLRGADAR